MTKTPFLMALFTEEDVGNLHKILGFSCLASFAYRYANSGDADANFGPNYGTLCFVVHHFLLHVSSFMFILPKKRIVSGYRIWPEARLHAMIFTSRSLSCLLLFYYEDVHQIKKPLHWMNLVIVLATCAAADWASSLQEYPSRTIRDLEFPPLWKWFFSIVQFVGTSICLFGGPPRRYSVQLNFVFTIQVNAFLMTLRRKNLASHSVLLSIYAAMLIAAMSLSILDDRYTHDMHAAAVVGIAAAMMRMNFGVSKYVLWIGVHFGVQYLRGMGALQTNAWWILGHGLSWIGAMTLGYCKTTTTSPVKSSPEKVKVKAV